MKKNIFVIALAAIALCFASCEKTPIENNEEFHAPRVATTADLTGTSWTSNLPIADLIYSMTGMNMEDYDIQFEEGSDLIFNLDFDNEYAHITFSDNIEMWQMVEIEGEYTMEQIEQMDLAYVYDGSTQTGTLTAVGVDEEGQPYNYQLPFSYDVVNDMIIINFEFAYDEENTTTFQMKFQRNEIIG